jgi:hypothetical protein
MSKPGPILLGGGVFLFLVGALGAPYGEDLGFPIWIFTWPGVVLAMLGAVLWLVERRRARP